MAIFRENQWLDIKNNFNKALLVVLFVFVILFFSRGFSELGLPINFRSQLFDPFFAILISIIVFRNKKYPPTKNKIALLFGILWLIFGLFLLFRFFGLV